MNQSAHKEKKVHLNARVKELPIPFVRDGLILGRHARIGCIAVRKALHLLVDYPFVHIEPNDDVIGDILIREEILQKVDQQTLTSYIIEHIKPIMSDEEILQLELDVDIDLAIKQQ